MSTSPPPPQAPNRRTVAAVLVAAVIGGYGLAAAAHAWDEPAMATASDDYGPGDGLTRLAVTADPGVGAAELVVALEALPAVAHAQPLDDGRVLVATEGLLPQEVRELPGVADARFSPRMSYAAPVTDPEFAAYGWNLDNTGSNATGWGGTPTADADVNAPAAWTTGTGTSMVVAVLDSGYDSDHPDLAGALWTNPTEACGAVDTNGNGKVGDCHGWNFNADSADVDNAGHGEHGTQVAGVVGARAGNGAGLAGVAPDVQIMPLAIGDSSGVDVNLAAQAIRYAVDNGAAVINASWGGPGRDPALEAAVAYAETNGVLVVAAAGNDGGNRDTTRDYPSGFPAANVVSVGASTPADTVAGFSAYGATTVDLFAPGERTMTTVDGGGYAPANGTSFAAPHVAAAIALYRAAHPLESAAQIKSRLLADVDVVPAFIGKSVTGGRLDLAALASAADGQLGYTFSSMRSAAGTVAPDIRAAGPAATGALSVALGLGMVDANEIWALSGEPITLGAATVSTDDTGTAVFPLGSGFTGPLDLAPTAVLGDGRYVLTVQLLLDGLPMSRAYAAPLLVGTAVPTVAPGTSSAPTTATGTPTGGAAPTTTAAAPTTGPAVPTATGSAPAGTSAPATSAPVTTVPATSAPVVPGTVAPTVTAGPTSSAPASSGASTSAAVTGSSAPAPTTAPGVPTTAAPTTTAPVTSAAATTAAPTATAPGSGLGGTKTYTPVAPFLISSISPHRVSTAGGTRVTITGTALPANAQVLVGASSSATVVSSTATEVRFDTPALVAGTYDVTVFDASGTVSHLLSGGLVYLAPGAGAPTGTAAPTAAPTSSAATTTAPAAVVRTGPGGERLVRSPALRAMTWIWGVDCATSCRGVAI